MSVIAGALGSVIGYLGAEVAKNTIFERLLWPQRFYNDLTLLSALKLVFLVPMGGPLHRAALETLDGFQEHGLYRGLLRGKMLGTMFYRELPHHYIPRSDGNDQGRKKEVRNCLWLEVLKHVHGSGKLESATPPAKSSQASSQVKTITSSAKSPQISTQAQQLGTETPSSVKRHRQIQTIYMLKIWAGMENETDDQLVIVQEDKITWHVIVGILCSEISAIVVAICVAVFEKYYWMTAYFCLPLILKYIALFSRVRRDPIDNGEESEDNKNVSGEENYGVFEVTDWEYGFIIIRSPDKVFRQFARHYGHPIRDGKKISKPSKDLDKSKGKGKTPDVNGSQVMQAGSETDSDSKPSLWGDKTREIISILTVYAFVLYFPAGLLVLIWERDPVQYIWLGYQIYLILMMHIARLSGWDSCARTEERIARYLQAKKVVRLESLNGQAVVASLEIVEEATVASAEEKVKEIVDLYLASSKVNL